MPFNSATSWKVYDASNTDGLPSKGFIRAVFDGVFIYFVPGSGIVLRYNTLESFNSSTSWNAYNATVTDGLYTTNFIGGTFDGRYIYFSPHYQRGSYHGNVLRYDTYSLFNSSTSWNAYNADFTSGLLTEGYVGAIYAGRYIYFAPFYANSQTPVLRFWPGFKNGSCECYENYSGPYCTECINNHYSPQCLECTTCINGRCFEGYSGDGSCICDPNYYGTSCEYFASIIVNEVIFNNLSISDNSLLINGFITVKGDLVVTNSTLTLSNSSVNVEECIILNKTTITVDLSNVNEKENLTLLNSTKGCLSGNATVTFSNVPKCTIQKSEMNSSSLYVIFIKDTSCSSTSMDTIDWVLLIILLSVVGFVLIAVAIILLVPKIRGFIFPFSKEENNKSRTGQTPAVI